MPFHTTSVIRAEDKFGFSDVPQIHSEGKYGFINIIRFTVKLIYKTYILFSIYTPFLIIAFLMIKNGDQTTRKISLPGYNTSDFSHALYLSVSSYCNGITGDQICFILILTYLLLCFLYLLKGIMIVLKNQNRRQWKFILIACSLITCIIPAWIAQLFIYSLLTKLLAEGLPLFSLSWIISVLPAYLIYRKHHFKLDTCPNLVVWAYLLGFKLLRKIIKVGRVEQAMPAR